MSQYLFDNAKEPDTTRLNAIESACDPITIAKFEQLGVDRGWNCLEIGAGAGSIAAWLSDRVGDRGTVLVTDIEPRFLKALEGRSANLEVRQHDITMDPLPASAFDLIHARHVLVHIPQAVATLSRLMPALKPGGWLVVEDWNTAPDRNALIVDPAKAAALGRVGDCSWHLFAKRGSEAGWANRLGLRFQQLGLENIGVDVSYQCVVGGSEAAQFFKMSWTRGRAEAVADGFASDADFDIALAMIDDPATLYYSNHLFTAWGRRPAPSDRTAR